MPSVNFTSLFPPVGRLFRRLSPPQRAIFAAALFYYPLLQAFFGVVRGRESRLRRAFCQFHAFVSSRWSSTLGLSYRPVFLFPPVGHSSRLYTRPSLPKPAQQARPPSAVARSAGCGSSLRRLKLAVALPRLARWLCLLGFSRRSGSAVKIM